MELTRNFLLEKVNIDAVFRNIKGIWRAKIYTSAKGTPIDVMVFAPDLSKAKMMIKSRPDFVRWSKSPKKVQ